MRIPFDLIAAILCVEGVGRYLRQLEVTEEVEVVEFGTIAIYWFGFWLISWLLNELIVRDIEWRTRFGFYPSGYNARRHPLVTFGRTLHVAQAGMVLLFAFNLYVLDWSHWVTQWPSWIGFAHSDKLGNLYPKDSVLAGLPLNLFPFLIAMLLGWVPRRRLASNLQGRGVPLMEFLSHEARLTWLPVALMFIQAAVQDLAAILPPRYTAWAQRPGMEIPLMLLGMGLLWMIALPKLIIWMWQCRPLPDGELKERLRVLTRRSGVKARDIMVWGPRGSTMLNACVMGAWSRYRYVMISPALVAELTPEETEAVMAHELGHARYGHLTLLFVMMLCLSAILTPVLEMLPKEWRESPLVETAAAIALVIVYIRVVFGMMNRQCEREADLASAELMGSPAPLVTALEKLAMITGNIRSVWSWHHGSMAERVDAVVRLSADPEGSRRFHARLRWMRIAFTVLTVAVLCAELVGEL